MSLEFVTTPQQKEEDTVLDITLRPNRFEDYIGQDSVKQNLHILMTAARQRKESIDHVLLHGGPGLGKTTLANIIAKEMNASIRITSGPAIERAGDLAAILTNLQPGDILFIDEIHRLHKTIEEMLYPAMEDYALDVIIGKGPAARTLRLDLPHFTIIGATTRPSLIAAPLRDRFGAQYHLDFYSEEEMQQIIHRSSAILAIEMNEDASKEIAQRSRRTPRIANRLLKRVRDYAQVKNNGTMNNSMAVEALNLLDIDPLGLNTVDRKILTLLIERFRGGPVGIQTIAAATGEDQSAIEELYEPFLMQMGFLNRTPRGRMATEHAYRHLNIAVPSTIQQQLL